MNTPTANNRRTEDEDADPVGPGDGQDHDAGARVEGGGGAETPPLNFDDDEIYSGRSSAVRSGGTTHSNGGDSAPLGPPAEILSNTNQPSAARKK